MGIFTKVAFGWLMRRVLDWGGWVGTFLLGIIGLYNTLPAQAQTAVQAALSGHWQNITLGSLVPLGALVISQVMSFRATVKPQVVTPAGVKVPMKDMPEPAQTIVEKAVATATRPKTLKDLFGKRK